MIWLILLVIICTFVVCILVIKKKHKDIRARSLADSKQRVQELIFKTNDSLSKYIQQIENGQDKYQIGRAVGRLYVEFQKEFVKLTGKTEAGHITKIVNAIANCDIQVENGMADTLSEIKRIDTQHKVENREQEKLAELKKQTELKEKIAANRKCAGCRRRNTCWKTNRKYCGGPF